MMHKQKLHAWFWLSSYLLLVLTPLLLMLTVTTPAKAGFWWDVGIGLGFSGLIMLVMQFFITSRLQKPAAPFGIDVIYYFHRCLGYTLLVIVLGHPLLLLAANPTLLTGFGMHSLSWAIVSGALSLSLILLVMVTSIWREQLGIAYDQWRQLHLLFASGAVVIAFAHMWEINYYSATPALKALWIIIAILLILLILQVRLRRPWSLLKKPWKVSSVIRENGVCWTLTLTPDGHSGLDFSPGQFAWLSLRHTPFAMKEHPFSMASAPAKDGSIQFTIKELGDFTRTIGSTKTGTRVYVDAPYGIFSIDRHHDAPAYVFIGGGIGIAPIFSMLQTLAQRQDKRPHVLFAAHSHWDRIPRREEILSIADQLNLTRVPILEEAPDDWQGESGYITTEILTRYLPDNLQDLEYFLCGPKEMLQAVREQLIELGVPRTQIHSELFDMA
jgi:predicted ferric reductase